MDLGPSFPDNSNTGHLFNYLGLGNRPKSILGCSYLYNLPVLGIG